MYMYHDKLVYKVVIWVFFEISLWKEKEDLKPLRTDHLNFVGKVDGGYRCMII